MSRTLLALPLLNRADPGAVLVAGVIFTGACFGYAVWCFYRWKAFCRQYQRAMYEQSLEDREEECPRQRNVAEWEEVDNEEDLLFDWEDD